MDLTGMQRIEASREAVWAALNNPDVLKRCIPGCESIDKISNTEMNAKVTIRIGPVKASFAGKVIGPRPSKRLSHHRRRHRRGRRLCQGRR